MFLYNSYSFFIRPPSLGLVALALHNIIPMIITKENYKSLKNQVEGHRLDQLNLNECYTALAYLTHRAQDESAGDQWFTLLQVKMVRDRQRKLLAEKGIYVLTA